MEGKKIGEFNIQITKFIYGEEAAKLALNNKSNAIPTADQQYLFFEVRLGYKSAILVENGFKPVTFRLQTGTNSYTWVKL